MDIFRTIPYIPYQIKIEDIAKNRICVSVCGHLSLEVPLHLRIPLRCLLCLMPGAPCLLLHIDGVAHEFDSVRGITEHVTPFYR